MNSSERPEDTNNNLQAAGRKNIRDKFATASLIIAILDFPFLVCGWLLALMSILFGAAGLGEPITLLGVILFLLPAILWIAGIGLGIVGLWSTRRIAAIIGIVLSGLAPLTVFFVLYLMDPY
jgi:hypothetical protein